MTDPSASRPLEGVKVSTAVVASLVANVAVAWVAWIVLPEPNGNTPTRSDFADWLWIVVASGASWSLIGVTLLFQRHSRRLGLAVLGGVAGAALVSATGLLMEALAAGS